MIAVIADDLTGAAELGGIGLRRGLAVRVCMEVPAVTQAGLLVIATDTRSMGRADAAAEMEKVTRQVMELKPEWIYKKTDSVLRGYVVDEIGAQLRALGLQRCLLVPANPSLGRTIHNGQYFINSQPIHQSSFSTDPEFPVASPNVLDMLVSREVQVSTVGSVLPESGIVVGEVQENIDLRHWAREIDENTLLAGAAGFFEAILESKGVEGRSEESVPEIGKPLLFVSGTTFDKSRRILGSAGDTVRYMPVDAEEIARLLREEGRAIVAIKPQSREDPHVLKDRMADLVSTVLSKTRVAELIIEGGSTAYAIFKATGIRTFIPMEELAPGVVRMHTSSMYVTVKPGSYQWPEKHNILPI
jgi:uncharacterized protein YgbK (DUF1537 family)